jgi:hypothetical protein
VHRRYYQRLLDNTEIISDFAFEIKCRVLLELRSKVTNKEELRAMDVEHLRMFKKFETLYKLREITLIWFIHFFANSTISINHVLQMVNQLFNVAPSYEFYFERYNILKKVQRMHMLKGDMDEMYKCREYFELFKQIEQLDIDVTKQYPNLLDFFDKNFAIKHLSVKVVKFYE